MWLWMKYEGDIVGLSELHKQPSTRRYTDAVFNVVCAMFGACQLITLRLVCIFQIRKMVTFVSSSIMKNIAWQTPLIKTVKNAVLKNACCINKQTKEILKS